MPAADPVPIVLHHGLLGSGDVSLGPLRLSYFRKIDRAIAARGHPVIVSRVHPTGPIELRARQLKVNMLRGLKQHDLPRDSRVLIIAHSMGGLDARHMIAELGMGADRVAGLLTITCPHRGSSYADWCVETLGKKLGCSRLLEIMGLDLRAVVDLTTENCRRFNREVKNVAGVQYFSASAARPWHRVPPWTVHAHKIVSDAEGDNDCVVSVKSSTWGRHLGVWPADHFHAINHRMVMEIKQPTGDITPYWMKAIEDVTGHL